MSPEQWGLTISDSGELMVGSHGTVDLARRFGTPLHVVNEKGLIGSAQNFISRATAAYPGRVSVYYALKCNSVPAVVGAIRSAGAQAEVMTEYELELALDLGFEGSQIIVNGPCKTDSFLARCLDRRVRLIIIDSMEELSSLAALARDHRTRADILLRINPGVVPRGMNSGTATGSRRCSFGFDLRSGEADVALRQLGEMESVNFLGFHMHIGTGIREPGAYVKALRRLRPIIEEARKIGFPVRILDVGGGFASMTTRELRTREELAYQAFNRLPVLRQEDGPDLKEFFSAISVEVGECFAGMELPELVYEPGRCIASPNQFLLLTVHRTKSREGIGTWLIADGGLSTVTLPTYYELHEVFLCNDVRRPRTQKATLIGPACFAGDIIYKNKPMPLVSPGEIIAIMDTGAYFTALESSFGFPRPAIVAVNGAGCRLVRSRETYEQMTGRDIFQRGPSHEIHDRRKLPQRHTEQTR